MANERISLLFVLPLGVSSVDSWVDILMVIAHVYVSIYIHMFPM